jgi:hypothetical protein
VSTDQTGATGPRGADPTSPGAQPSEEELRAAYEAELSRITAADMMLQAAVSLLNIGGYRLAPATAPAAGAPAPGSPGGDLDQVRDAIDGVRALMEILERRLPAGELAPLRNALSQLQIAYAREMQAAGHQPPATAPADEPAADGGGQGQTPAGGAPPAGGQAPAGDGQPGPGPAESSGRLWVPGR